MKPAFKLSIIIWLTLLTVLYAFSVVSDYNTPTRYIDQMDEFPDSDSFMLAPHNMMIMSNDINATYVRTHYIDYWVREISATAGARNFSDNVSQQNVAHLDTMLYNNLSGGSSGVVDCDIEDPSFMGLRDHIRIVLKYIEIDRHAVPDGKTSVNFRHEEENISNHGNNQTIDRWRREYDNEGYIYYGKIKYTYYISFRSNGMPGFRHFQATELRFQTNAKFVCINPIEIK